MSNANTNPLKALVEPLEGISCQVSELEALLETTFTDGTHDARTGCLISIAERLAHLLQNDVISLITTCHNYGKEGVSHE
ncbi:hypothetical protein [Thiothrix subterranea]|uniref:Uncharacterized protein n=1 Tax=Thiothrix subterranea TaxID=2735563 RepID=A0AA51MRA2_9GAMM|nr:hypothetical protein [Thiothrix subterranea]MDQ5770486.1 hypothetical protein [Thiothrix subterranea]WML86836.1 hypothetical protein RCG00_21460 [Thiothrix subterranea]